MVSLDKDTEQIHLHFLSKLPAGLVCFMIYLPGQILGCPGKNAEVYCTENGR